MKYVRVMIKKSASSRWSSRYCPTRSSDQLAIGKTLPTLPQRYTWERFIDFEKIRKISKIGRCWHGEIRLSFFHLTYNRFNSIMSGVLDFPIFLIFFWIFLDYKLSISVPSSNWRHSEMSKSSNLLYQRGVQNDELWISQVSNFQGMLSSN